MNHSKLKIALASAALAVSGAAMAQSPQWSYFQGQAGWADSGNDGENTQYGAALSLQAFDILHFGGQFTTGKFDSALIDDSDVENWNIFFGFHTSLASNTDIFADAIFGNVDPDDLGDDDDYYGGRFGVRYIPIDQLEINGGVQAVYLDDDESNQVTGWVGGRVLINDSWSAGVTFTPDDFRHLEEDSLTIDIRFGFGDQSWLGNN